LAKRLLITVFTVDSAMDEEIGSRPPSLACDWGFSAQSLHALQGHQNIAALTHAGLFWIDPCPNP